MIFRVLLFAVTISCGFSVAHAAGDREPMGLAEYEGDAPPPALSNIYEKFLYKSVKFLAEQLRWPDDDEAGAILQELKNERVRGAASENREEVSSELDFVTVQSLLAMSEHGVMEDVRRLFGNRYLYIRRKIANAYSRAIRQTDLEARYRTVPRTPSVELFFYAALKSKSNGGPKLLWDYARGKLSIENFKDLFIPGRENRPRAGSFPQPLIFPEGLKDIELTTRFDAPFAFRNYVDTDLINDERGMATLKAIEKAKGFVAVSWTSGKPLNKDYLDSVLAMLEERDWIMVVCPTQQNYEGLPEIFLNHPRIHLLTNTIENRYLKLSNMALTPTIENPLPNAKKAGGFRPGQTVIVFHPHLMMETVATTTNEFLPVQVWSTGSINEPFGPFTSPTQGTRNETNKVFHKMKFLIVEKGDGISRFDSDVLQNIWHVRPVSFYDDREHDGTAGFIDMGRTFQFHYTPQGERHLEVFNQDPKYIYLGDMHDRVTDPSFVKSLVEDVNLTHETQVTFVTGDVYDGGAINHWIDDKKVAQNKKHQDGELSALDEVNRMITSINALLDRYPKARFAQIVGNHDEWMSRLLDKVPQIHDVLNGDFLDELGFAVKTLNMNVWEYIFKHRQETMGAILSAHPDKRREILGRVLPIHDASRIDIITRDQKLYAGPEWRKNAIHYHGDKGSGPKGGAFKEHARAMPEGGGVTGHTHKPKIYSEVMDVGVMAPVVQDYTQGTYGGQGQGFAPIYANGTKQLMLFNRLAHTFHQRFPAQVPPPAKFFGEDRLKLVPNDNDLVDKGEGEEKILAELKRLRRMTGGACEDSLTGS